MKITCGSLRKPTKKIIKISDTYKKTIYFHFVYNKLIYYVYDIIIDCMTCL